MQRALPRRRRCAAAHLSVTLRVPPFLKERLWARCLRGKAPLEGSWRVAPERCYPHRRLSAGHRRLQRTLPRRRRCAAAHLSVTLRVPPPLKGRLWGPSSERERLPSRGAVSRRLTERCYRTKSFPQGIGVCRGRFRAAAAARRHTSPSRFACHLPSRGGFGVRRLRGAAALKASRRVSAHSSSQRMAAAETNFKRRSSCVLSSKSALRPWPTVGGG